MADENSAWWRQWITPAAVLTIGGLAIGIFSCQLGNVESRITNLDAKIDRRGEAIEDRLSKTTDRLDSGLEKQSEFSIKLNKVESDVQYMRQQLNGLEQGRIHPEPAR